MRTIVYSIDTIPDLDFGKKHMNLEGLSDADIGRSMFFQQLQKQGDELLPIDLQKIVSISCIVDHNERNELYTYTKLEPFIDSIKDVINIYSHTHNKKVKYNSSKNHLNIIIYTII